MPGIPKSPHPTMPRAVDRQVLQSELYFKTHYKPAPTGESAAARTVVQDFLTLSNLVGSGGREIADLIGQRLGWPVYDRDLVMAMAQQDRARADFYASMDERDVGWLEETIRTIMNADYNRNDYFHRLMETVLCLARQKPAIFVGRAADLILPRDRGLRVRLMASYDYRVRSFAEHAHLTARESARRIAQVDRERAAFIQNHFKRDEADLSRFDLIVNLERFSSARVVDLVTSTMKHMGMPIEP